MGLTIIHLKNRASVTVDVRGGGPGTVNTDGLRNAYSTPFTDTIVFTGGSAYGEEAITAVATGLKDLGLRGGDWEGVAFATGAVIYDLGNRRLNEIYADKRLAHAALRALRPGVFPSGLKAPAAWRCKEAILVAMPIQARVQHFGKSVPPRSPLSS